MVLSPKLTNQDELFDYIDEPEHIQTIERLIQEAGLGPEAFDVVAPMQDMVAMEKLDPKAIPERLIERLDMDEVAARSFAKVFTRDLLYPMKDLVPAVAHVIQAWEITLGKSAPKTTAPPEKPHKVQQVSANAFVHDELERYNLQLPDPAQQKKFEIVLSEFIAGKRNRESTLQALIRPRKIGGLELDKRATNKLLDGLSEDAKHVPEAVSARSETTPQPSQKSSDTEGSLAATVATGDEIPKTEGADGKQSSKEVPEEDSGLSDSVIPTNAEGSLVATVATGDEIPNRRLSEFVPDRRKHPEPKEPVPQEEPAPQLRSQKDALLAEKKPSKPQPKPLPPRTIVKLDDSNASRFASSDDVVGTKRSSSKVASPALPDRKPERFDPTTIRPEDEKEIEAHRERLPKVKPVQDIETATREVIEKIGAAGTLDAEGKKKLHTIVKTRLKGIRDGYKTRAALETKEGGLGWSGGDLTQALEVIEDMATTLEGQAAKKVAKEKEAHVKARAARFNVTSKESSGTAVAIEDEIPVGAVGQPPTKFGTAGSPNLSSVAATFGNNSEPLASGGRSLARAPKRKGKVRDVAVPRRLSGPVEELSSMTIADFRRLGATGEEAAEEVRERIELLEKQSYGERLKGIAAWRGSSLYETYVSLVSEAMRSHKPIEDVLSAHRASGEDVLTKEELQALIKLNGTLRV